MITPGTRLGPYDITAKLGEGGMGEVYRATDSNLKRSVAIKVLPAAMASDADRLARFQREAEVLAALNHPNIAAIYGLEKTPDFTALVMELVEGEDLSAIIARGALPLSDTVPIAKQIAEALEAAHEQGIVHRDLKPANIKVRADGTVKVLDFGLAKAMDSGTAGPQDANNSPTLTNRATQIGMILGTAAYMAPEQARGKVVDRRADIWAFGVVLYEMLTGRRAFEGEDISITLANVMKDDVAWDALPAHVPPPLLALLRRCLEKDPKRRLGWIGEARLALEDRAPLALASSDGATVTAVGRPRRRVMPWMAAAVAGAVLVTAAAWSLLTRRAPDVLPMHLQVGFTPAESVLGAAPLERGIGGGRPSRTALALSPDGRWLVFAGTQAGVQQLYLRDLTRDEATPIEGTKDGDSPFLSPGGEWVGFWAAGALRKVPIGGGPVTEICKTSHISGASWGGDDRIVFAQGGSLRACTAGSESAVVARPDREAGETSYRLPFLMPGGQNVLFTIVSGRAANSAKVAVRSLASGEQRVLVENASDGRYVPSGHLVFVRQGTLMAAPFDPDSLALTGAAVALVENVMVAVNEPNTDLDTAAGQFALSAAGHLIYLAGGMFPDVIGTLVWLDRDGRLTPLDTPPRGYQSPQLSPDARRIVVQSVGVERAVWVVDISRGTASKLQFDGLAEWPIWTPDGQRVVFSGSKNGVQNLYWMRADGSDRAERLTTSEFNQLAATWSADGRELIFIEERQKTRDDIYALSIADRTTRPILENPAGETHPTISPDGRWLAYVSDDSGRAEVFVTPYGGPAGRVQVSVAGGSNPRWTRDGRELVFSVPVRDGVRTIMSAAITGAPVLAAGVPRRFTAVAADEFSSTTPIPGFDIAADGRLLGATRRRPAAPPPTSFSVLLNWAELLRTRTGR